MNQTMKAGFTFSGQKHEHQRADTDAPLGTRRTACDVEQHPKAKAVRASLKLHLKLVFSASIFFLLAKVASRGVSKDVPVQQTLSTQSCTALE